MFLELKNISKSYSQGVVVNNVGFSLAKGDMLCLLGPSGCGKSTILKMIGGFVKQDQGQIILDGTDIGKLPPEDRDVATVFQSYGLFPHMNVLDNVCYGLKIRKIKKAERKAQGMEMLKTIGLAHYATKEIAKLSGGEQQRVALARALIIKPKLLLLDEPLSNLDERLRLSMREEIKRIQRQFHITAIFVTHDQQEAFEIADQILLLNKGELMQQGSAEDLYRKPQNEFVRHFIGSANHLPNTFIRKEQIVFCEKGEDTMEAEVLQHLFLGEKIKYTLQCPLGVIEAVELSSAPLRQGKVYIQIKESMQV